MQRIAVIFDHSQRPETTGVYCRRALGQLVQAGRIAEVEHFLPGDLDRIPPNRFDLFLYVDDGINERIRDDLRPAVWWAIDTHLGFDRCLGMARQADLTFAAQHNGTAKLQGAGIAGATWLPLACDPEIHGRKNVPIEYDVAFVGHRFPGPREELLELLHKSFPKSFMGRCYFEEMAAIYSSSRTVFNRSILDDVNMRVFEGLCSGSLLITNDLLENGQDELFRDGIHCATYRDDEELLEKLRYYLAHDETRERIAAAGRKEVTGHHTYRHRMETILDAARRRPLPVAMAGFVKDRSYFEHDRPDVLELIPVDARRVLDIGCGAGRLGAALKTRQVAEVVGIERENEAAALAKARLDHVLVADVERDEEFPWETGTFDCIICADVLEHLREPEGVLKKVHRWLSPGGCLITSLPNVRHSSVVRSLLAGNWTYESAGLLDEDHVRFFTRREIEKLLFRGGFELDQLRLVPGEGYHDWLQRGRPTEVHLGDVTVQTASAAEAEEFYAYQYLARSRSAVAADYGLTSIILVTHDQLAYTKACLESIRLRTDEPYELIVVDNGSTDGTPEFLQGCPDVRLIANDENRGFPAAVNQGLRAASGVNLLLLNNDTIVTTGWLKRMLRALHSGEDIGLVGPVSNNVSGPQQVSAEYTQLADLDGFAWDWGKRHRDLRGDVDRLVGFCLLCKRQLIDQIGVLDERFGIGNFEDDDFCRRARAAGYRAMIAIDTFIHHFGSVTFRGSGVNLGAVLQENRHKYLAKWSENGTSASQGADVNNLTQSRDDQVLTTQDHPAPLCEEGAEKSRPTLGCVLAVRNRPLEQIERTLQTYAIQTLQPTDRILVDDGSSLELHAHYRTLCARYGWRLIRIDSQDIPWSLARAYNVAVSRLRPDVGVVFKSDVDVLLTSDVLERAARSGREHLCVFQCVSTTAESKHIEKIDDSSLRRLAFERCVSMNGEGVHSFPRDWFTSLGGYDLAYSGWGFEDSDLRLRAERSIGVCRDQEAVLIHQWHPRQVDDEAAGRNHHYYQSTKQQFTLVRNARRLVEPDLTVREVAPPEVQTPDSLSDLQIDRPPDVRTVAGPRPYFLFDVNDEADLLLRLNDIRLSACLIVRNNEMTIRPCLESLQPFVDEIVIVDTGSNDDTPRICEELGARVFHWSWKDSFSAARNVSFDLALGEWIFWMDSDDTLPEKCGRKLRDLALAEHPQNVHGYVIQVHCPGANPNDLTVVDHVKLIRNCPDLRFEFRIHEQILPAIRRAGGDVGWTDIHVVHSGSDRTSGGRERKLDRDFRLLSLDLKERPDHPFVLFNLGMTHADARQHGKAVQYLQRCLEVSQPEESHVRKAYALLLGSLVQSAQPEDAWEVCCRGLAAYPDDKELLFRRAMLEHHFGQLTEAVATYHRVLEEPMPRHFASIDQGIVDYKARHNLAVVYEDMGRFDEAESEWRRILIERPDYGPAHARVHALTQR